MLALAIKKSYSPKATKKEILYKKLPTPLPGDLMVRPSVVRRGGSTNSVVWTLLNTNFINSVTQTKVYMNTHVVTRFNSDNNSIFLYTRKCLYFKTRISFANSNSPTSHMQNESLQSSRLISLVADPSDFRGPP